MTTSLPSGFVEAVHCDDCGDQMAPDPDIRAVTDRDICPVCLEGYL
jgi:formylmethanofuran dehydrogenase subunit E